MALAKKQTQEIQTQQTQSQSQTQDTDIVLGHQKGKFDHLLKPIKNIALSWGIDIAAELSNYAASLGIALNTTDSEGHQVDFAEAALLLQGSTTIYCRKIEHLYRLVLSAVEVVNQVKSRQLRPATDDTGDGDASENDDDPCWISDELDFLSLDIPMLDEKKINRRERNIGTFQNAGNDSTLLAEIPHLLRTPMGSEGADVNGSETLRMNLGTVDESGALLLRGAKEMNFELAPNATTGTETLKNSDSPSSGAHIPLSFEDDDYENAPSPEFMRTGASPLPFNMDDSVHSLGFAAAPPPVKTEKPWLLAQSPVVKRERERVDPFLELDPHDDMGIHARPVRMRSTISRPRPPKESEDVKQCCLADAILGTLPAKGSSNRYVAFGALRETVAKVVKKRIAMKRMRPALAVVRIADEIPDLEAAEGTCGGDVHCDTPLFGADDDGYGSNADGCADSEPLLSLGGDLELTSLGEDLGLPDYNRGILGTDRYWQDVVDGYQRACRRYMQETTNLWEKQVVNAALVERVEKWREKISPALELEEKRPPYDIQGYGDNVLNRIVALDVTEKNSYAIEMKTALRATDQFEVCRMFLATLQLANNYDVEICPDEDDSGERLSPKIKLLDSARVMDVRRPLPSPGQGSQQIVESLTQASGAASTPPRRSFVRAPLADKTPTVRDENIPNVLPPDMAAKESLPRVPRKSIKRKRGRGTMPVTPVSKRRSIRTRTYLR